MLHLGPLLGHTLEHRNSPSAAACTRRQCRPPQRAPPNPNTRRIRLTSIHSPLTRTGDRANRCHKSWSFERVIGWVLNNLEKRTILTKTRLECLLACYNEQSFQCKSFNYDSASGSCQLSDMDRHSLASAALRRRHYVESSVDTIDYGENNCVHEARGICDFKPLANRILKTVDSIYQDIKSEPECRKRCLQSAYRCHSYDLGDSSNPVCRTSHLDRNSLQQIQDPYLDIQGSVSYELDSCYNVTVVCKSREMVARVKTNKVFNGKIYAKNAPLSCVNDVTNSMDFELSMAFNDACSISRSANTGVFSNEIVLQHNDMIVTNSDMGLNVKCQYDLRNQTVYNNINLDDFMTGREPIDIASQSAVVRSPNISMQILRHDGNHITQAQVGDALMLRFQITDERSPFEIFVRDLYAMDGVGGTEIMLIDAEGCPTDPSIMAAMSNAKGNGQTLEAQFDAFKFPTSETVAFRGLVTPCIPHCEPVHCQNRVFDGTLYEAESYGKRRRRKRSAAFLAKASGGQRAPEEVIVRNSIEIRDKLFGDAAALDSDPEGVSRVRNSAYELEAPAAAPPGEGLARGLLRFGGVGILFGALMFSQVVLLVGWLAVWRRRRFVTAQPAALVGQLAGRPANRCGA